jgi:glutamyl-tRNA synthetase
MTIAASDFEDWRRCNQTASYKDFKFNLKKMSVSGALFDSVKLLDVSKNLVSRLSSVEVYNFVTA